jgi:hypothetical protein
LTAAYYEQGRRYLGSILASPDGKIKRLSRVAIYPRGIGGELKEALAGKVPFDLAAASMIVPRAGKSRLFQQLVYTSTTERSAIREDAVLIHSDKESVLLSALIEEATKPADPPHHTGSSHLETDGAATVEAVASGEAVQDDDPEPTDRRTRAWKEWAARHEPTNA